MSDKKGNLVFVLHAHLPYVRHPEHEIFLEENWFFEGLIETYLPLLAMFDRLNRDGVPFRITMTLSPTLVSMMEDPLLMGRFEKRLSILRDLSEREVIRTRGTEFEGVARFYRDHLEFLERVYRQDLGRNLPGAFRRHMESGSLDGITCGATHGFLPFLQEVPGSAEAQVRVGGRREDAHAGQRRDCPSYRTWWSSLLLSARPIRSRRAYDSTDFVSPGNPVTYSGNSCFSIRSLAWILLRSP